MVLTDREIQSAIQHDQIKIDPRPTDPAAYGSTSLDLTLGKSVRAWKATAAVVEFDHLIWPALIV
jgi:deoxycytidine triphosphate deaminase